jgi:signal transduction histidine kinase/CheY-like chemotaxis protein
MREVMRGKWRSAPLAVFGAAILILIAGIAIILQYNVSYGQERLEQVQGLADILAASEAAPLDFDDPVAAQESVNAFRVNNQVRMVGVYDRNGRAIAGYNRSGSPVPQTISTMPPAGGSAMRVSAPVEKAGQRIGTIYFDVDREAGSRRITRYSLMFVLAFVAALVVTGLGIAQAQLREANRELTDRADALTQANDLLEEQMEERAKAEDQLRQSQKMQALGQLTGGIAHDFNNLLTVIQGSADMLCRPNLTETKRLRFAQAIVQAGSNAASLTSQLLSFARRQPLKPEHVEINRLVRDMQDMIDRTIGERIELVLDLAAEGRTVEVDKAQLQSAILNITTNSHHAMPNGGTLTIRTRNVEEAGHGQGIAIEISDTGQGMDTETLDRAFEPFFTTKGTGKGTGLGLSQVYGFATQSGGDAGIESRPGQGTAVTLVLPCLQTDESIVSAAVRASRIAEQQSSSVLVVEDNIEVGAFAEALLSELGHKVTRASSGEEALELVRTGDFDIVFSDVVMPGIGGLKLAEILGQEKPDLPVVLATGYSQEIAETGAGGRPVILKPYRLTTLSEALSEALRTARRK